MSFIDKKLEEYEKRFVFDKALPDYTIDRDDAKIFLRQALLAQQALFEQCVPEEKSPYLARLCKNRNGLDYCGTCEQAWEDCSCPARNTGFNACRNEILNKIKELN